jgi:hypothetical protein
LNPAFQAFLRASRPSGFLPSWQKTQATLYITVASSGLRAIARWASRIASSTRSRFA